MSYKYVLALLKGGNTFNGQAVIKFNLTPEAANSDKVFLDYKGEMILKMRVNSWRVTGGNPFRDHRIYFPKDLLIPGANEVKITFESKYVRDC